MASFSSHCKSFLFGWTQTDLVNISLNHPCQTKVHPIPSRTVSKAKFPLWVKAWEAVRGLRKRENNGKRWTERKSDRDKQRETELSAATVQSRLHAGSVVMLIQPNGQGGPLCFSRQLILLEQSKARFQTELNKSAYLFSEPINVTRRWGKGEERDGGRWGESEGTRAREEVKTKTHRRRNTN